MPDDLQPNTDLETATTPPEAPQSSFTQDEVNRIAKQSKQEATRVATAELMKKLGIEDVESAAALLADANRRKEAELSEAERAKADADREKSAAAQERAEAAAERRTAKIERQLVRAGLPEDALDDASVLVTAKLADDASDDDIAEAVTALKERRAELFASEPRKVAPDSHVNGRTRTTTSSSAPGGLAAGAERAKNFSSPLIRKP